MDTNISIQCRLSNAEHFMQLLGTLPEEKQAAVVMMANAFLQGMNAQERISSFLTVALRARILEGPCLSVN